MNNSHSEYQRTGRRERGNARSRLPSKSLRSSARVWWPFSRSDKNPVWRFGLLFGALMVLFYVLILTPFFDRMLYVYLAMNARVASGILNWLGQTTQVSEVTVRSAHFAIAVRRGCDAVEPSWFLCAALLAFPASVGRRALGMLVGVMLLQVLNLIRFVSLFLLGLNYPRWFNMAHVEIWPAVFILVAIALWIGWIDLSRRSVPAIPHATA